MKRIEIAIHYANFLFPLLDGSLRGPLDGQSLEYHQNVYRIFEPPSYELLGEYWHQDGTWMWRPSSKRTNEGNELEPTQWLADRGGTPARSAHAGSHSRE